MKKNNLQNVFVVTVAVIIVSGLSYSSSTNSEYYPLSSKVETKAANTPFDKMMLVLTHERCVNCHPNDHIPKQEDDSHPHYFGIAGGKDDIGYEATNCATCHQKENNNYAGVPGAPEWSLAPAKMKWEGLSRVEIAHSMLNPENNGNRNHEQLVEHLTEHELVLWAWEPGVNAAGIPREKPPVPLEEYKKAVKEWFENGAVIPEE